MYFTDKSINSMDTLLDTSTMQCIHQIIYPIERKQSSQSLIADAKLKIATTITTTSILQLEEKVNIWKGRRRCIKWLLTTTTSVGSFSLWGAERFYYLPTRVVLFSRSASREDYEYERFNGNVNVFIRVVHWRREHCYRKRRRNNTQKFNCDLNEVGTPILCSSQCFVCAFFVSVLFHFL